MERKLATIEKIISISPIKNADKIEKAQIRGWDVVVKKGEFKIGDIVIYCEIDSVMPKRPEFEFLENKKYRIKTMKMRGQISQGIVFPIDIFLKVPESGIVALKRRSKNLDAYDLYFDDQSMMTLVPGIDVTEMLGVTKYEASVPAELNGKVIGEFPSHSIKTDEERMQNLMHLWDEGFYHLFKWYETEKLDGTSATFSVVDDEFQICGRNWRLSETAENSFWKVARRDNIEETIREMMSKLNLRSLTLQGELIGEGIQSNKYKIKGQKARFFRAFLPEEYRYLEYDKFLETMLTTSLETVPIIHDDFILPEKFEDLLLHVEGRSELYKTAREGSVFVAKNVPVDLDHGRLSFKVISNKFILKHDE